jgi:hypothetical protein
MSRVGHIVTMFLLFLAILVVTLQASAQSQEKNVKVIFTIRIYDIDRLTRNAQVDVMLAFENLTSQQVAKNEPIRAILIGGANIIYVSCNETSSDEYAGSSGIINWSITGPLARGEYFPFDEGQLFFQIANVLPGPFNLSEAEVDTSRSFAYFDGDAKSALNETYNSSGNAFTIDTQFGPDLEATVPLIKRADAV